MDQIYYFDWEDILKFCGRNILKTDHMEDQGDRRWVQVPQDHSNGDFSYQTAGTTVQGEGNN